MKGFITYLIAGFALTLFAVRVAHAKPPTLDLLDGGIVHEDDLNDYCGEIKSIDDLVHVTPGCRAKEIRKFCGELDSTIDAFRGIVFPTDLEPNVISCGGINVLRIVVTVVVDGRVKLIVIKVDLRSYPLQITVILNPGLFQTKYQFECEFDDEAPLPQCIMVSVHHGAHKTARDSAQPNTNLN